MKALLAHLILASRMVTGGHEKGYAWFGLDSEGQVQDNGIQDQLFSWEGFEEDETFTDMVFFDCVLTQPLGSLPAGTHVDIIELELSTSSIRVYKTRKGKRVQGVTPDELLFEGSLTLSVQPRETSVKITEEEVIPDEEETIPTEKKKAPLKAETPVSIPDEEEEENLSTEQIEVDEDDTF